MKKIICLTLVLLMVLPLMAQAQSVSPIPQKTLLYVSTDGSDDGDGSEASPFATVTKARDVLREMKNAGTISPNGATVLIRGGKYTIEKGIYLGQEDSGNENAPIVYRNYPGEEVIFTGAAEISKESFKKVTDEEVLSRIVDEGAREKVVYANLFDLGYTNIPELSWPGAYSYSWGMQQIHGKAKPEAVAPELIINGNAMTIARYPNNEYMYVESVVIPGENVRMWYDDKAGTPEYIPLEERTETPFTISFADERIKNWTKAKDALITGLFFHAWADQTVPVAKVDAKKMRLTSEYPSEYTIAPGAPVYVYNLVEEIDVPGEYFVDRKSGNLYLYMPEEEINSIIYTTLEDYMFSLDNCKYVDIKGINMSYMRSGAVKMSNVENCNLTGCEIFYTGNQAVSVSGSFNSVKDCYVHDAEGGISLSGGDRNTLTYGNNVMENNELERCDRISKTYKQAAYMSGVGNYMLHNEIHDASHTIVGFSGNDQFIKYNEIYDAVKYADDMGAIYAGRNLTCRGNEIFYNYLHDIGGADLGSNGVQAVFLDDWFSEAEIKGNVFENIHGPAIRLAGSYNEINNNIFVNIDGEVGSLTRSYAYGNTDSEYTYREGIKAVPYLSEVWLEKYPEIANVIDENDRLDMNNYIKATKNVIYKGEDFKTSAQIAETATIENNVIFEEDPGFVDLENRNLSLKEDSIVYEEIEGFEAVPFDEMGRYGQKALDMTKNSYVVCENSYLILKLGEVETRLRVESFTKDGEMYIALRTGVEALNGEVSYDETTEEIKVLANGKTLEFKDGEVKTVTFDNEEYTLSVDLVNFMDTNYISLSDLAKMFNCYVLSEDGVAVITLDENVSVNKNMLRYLKEQISVY